MNPQAGHPLAMLTEIYIEALLVDEVLADQVWTAWDKGAIGELIRKTSDSAKYIPTRNGSDAAPPAGRRPGQLNRIPGSNASQKRSI